MKKKRCFFHRQEAADEAVGGSYPSALKGTSPTLGEESLRSAFPPDGTAPLRQGSYAKRRGMNK